MKLIERKWTTACDVVSCNSPTMNPSDPGVCQPTFCFLNA